MRVLVTGGRDFTDFQSVSLMLSRMDLINLPPITELCHGGARGADTLCGAWAKGHGIPVTVMKPDWNKHGKAAGVLRNQDMLDQFKPDALVAFPGGRGTADMVRRAESAGVPVYRHLDGSDKDKILRKDT